jgi:hypothetical protein
MLARNLQVSKAKGYDRKIGSRVKDLFPCVGKQGMIIPAFDHLLTMLNEADRLAI